MIIVLEGCDCVGKTTFAEMLAEKTGFEIVKGSSFEISELGADGMFNYMMELLDRKNIIIDRFFYSNLVYGELFSYPMMTEEQYDLLVEKLDKNGLVVYIHAPEGTITHRMANRGDDMIKAENVESILAKYVDVLFGDFRPKSKLVIDSSTASFNSATSMINEMTELDMFKTFIKL
jgi:thymidylate kinase